jgi:hypothetical protein
LTQATTKPAPCQVRSKTESPCLHRAVVEVWGVPFCEACAREQEAYFAIGELTWEAQDLRSEPLGKTLGDSARMALKRPGVSIFRAWTNPRASVSRSRKAKQS